MLITYGYNLIGYIICWYVCGMAKRNEDGLTFVVLKTYEALKDEKGTFTVRNDFVKLEIRTFGTELPDDFYRELEVLISKFVK